ncbi:MAG: DMT family transporter [Rhodospirillaceae bacterium]|jgi:drug/metabolite transporter (DMT)-like permease|nr:DMT family transporter [Rhodospirillaceae bacterium]MBT3808362.1 DMT family transporter [Rhodospirillaceae bacterium]MBT3931535.1 DMT family transporter [Rhodospirillaceae bacterium]MBT4772598.1 DMT family transporter [Rhodospirillaceae bacterium]MBT5359025.1 DMT family transporter [Rhodospirillaceae bacterium]
MASSSRSGNHLKGIAITATGVAILSPDGLITSLVSADIRTSLFWRGLLLGIAMTLFVVVRYRRDLGQIFTRLRQGSYLAVALLFTGSSIGWVVAIVTTSVANTLFIVACAPLFAAIFARVFLGERVPGRTIITIIIAIGAMAVIFAEGLGRGDLLGNLAAVATALTWAGMVVVLSHAQIDDPAPAMALSGYMVAALALIVAPTIAVVTLDMLWLGLLGFVVLPISFFMIMLGPRHLPAPEVSLIMLLEAVLGPIWAWWFISQTPSTLSLIGGAVILGTLAIHFAIGLREAATKN